MSKQPEALRLASMLDDVDAPISDRAAAELRRLHSVNADLLEALKTLAVFLPSDHHEPADNERIQPGFIYIRWGDLRAARAAIARAEET